MNSDIIYDVVIVGAGPAGLWAALELANEGNVLLIEAVRRLHDTRNVSNGFMGGSAKSDVNLFVEPGYGGHIKNMSIIEYFISYMQSFSSTLLKIKKYEMSNRHYSYLGECGVSVDEPASMSIKADKFTNIEVNIKRFLEKNIHFRPDCQFIDLSKNKKIFEIQTSNGIVKAHNCILALGRGGGFFLKNTSLIHKLSYEDNRFNLGVRIEFPHSVVKDLADKSPFFRLKWDNYRTTSLTIKGFVEMEDVYDVKTSNGRSIKGKATFNTNIGLLKTFESSDALNKVCNLVQIANILGDGQLLREPVSRVLNNKWALGPLPEFESLINGIQKLVTVFPDIKTRGYVYSPEARINTFNFKISKNMETEMKNLYIVGDMTGITNSFVQAACSGLIAAKHIIEK